MHLYYSVNFCAKIDILMLRRRPEGACAPFYLTTNFFTTYLSFHFAPFST
ncbi:hypothetical protein Barb7_01507 [Bacteroidales bacterium Barb7]|nr:hypothetical protein Barb7_01507 [Bacteroidales bacterium Barb7]